MTPDELLNSISDAERAERTKRGLPAHHILDMSEFPFAYARGTLKRFTRATAQWALNEPADAGAQSFNAWARVLLGDYAGADAALRTLQTLLPQHAIARMRFTEIPGGEPVTLPPVRGDWPTHPAFFVACDPIYLAKHAMPLLRSIAHCAPGAAVHVHVMGDDLSTLEKLDLRLSITVEDPSPLFARGLDPKMYYHAARLVRFAEALGCAGTLVMSDADALVTADPRPLLAGGLGLRVRPGRIEPWHHFSACLVRGSQDSLPYFNLAADIVRRLLDAPFWGLDQYALFAAYVRLTPSLELFGPDVTGVADDEPGLFWFTAGHSKLDLMSSPSPYAQTYRRYAGS